MTNVEKNLLLREILRYTHKMYIVEKILSVAHVPKLLEANGILRDMAKPVKETISVTCAKKPLK